MRKHLAILACVLLSAPWVKGAANGDLDRILTNMQQAAKSVKTVQARLQHEKRHSQIGGRELYRGNLLFKHVGANQDRVRIDYDSTNQVVVVDGNRITLYQPRINQAIKTCRAAVAKGNQEFALFETPYTSVRRLKELYNIDYVRDEQLDSAATSVIELRPKASTTTTKKLTLWIDQASWLPVKYQILEQNDSVSTFTLTEVKRNVSLRGDAFKINWPSSTKVIVERGC